jgi:transcriptional regulator with XRE-family HTH domain
MTDERAVREPRTADWRLRVKSLREARNLSGAVLARKVGISRAHLWNVETGTKDPSITVARKIAAGLGISLAELLREDEAAAGVRLDVDALEQAVRTITNRHGLGITITANGQWFGRPRFTAEVAAEYERLASGIKEVST